MISDMTARTLSDYYLCLRPGTIKANFGLDYVVATALVGSDHILKNTTNEYTATHGRKRKVPQKEG